MVTVLFHAWLARISRPTAAKTVGKDRRGPSLFAGAAPQRRGAQSWRGLGQQQTRICCEEECYEKHGRHSS